MLERHCLTRFGALSTLDAFEGIYYQDHFSICVQNDGFLELHAYAADRTEGGGDTVIGHPRAFTTYINAGACMAPWTCASYKSTCANPMPSAATSPSLANVALYRACKPVSGSMRGGFPQWPAYTAIRDIAPGAELIADVGSGYIAQTAARSRAEQRISKGIRGEAQRGGVVVPLGDYKALSRALTMSQVLALTFKVCI